VRSFDFNGASLFLGSFNGVSVGCRLTNAQSRCNFAPHPNHARLGYGKNRMVGKTPVCNILSDHRCRWNKMRLSQNLPKNGLNAAVGTAFDKKHPDLSLPIAPSVSH
jgi:hypothetical protein